MPRTSSGRVTQRRIAELAGVSQATVSLVLNERTGPGRIPPETRDRVLRVIQETQYVADPSARRLAGMDNRIIGVFTYEPAFPTGSQDFYAPLLTGIEAEAERAGCDLMLFTSAPVRDGRRRIFDGPTRLRLADGVLLLGLTMDAAELGRLVDGGFRVVAVGRRDAPEIPYVGIDYVSATRDLVGGAVEQGHRRVLFLHLPPGGESVRDRLTGVRTGAAGAHLVEVEAGPGQVEAAWSAVEEHAPTLVVVEDAGLAAAVLDRARAAGLRVPGRLSVVALGAPGRAEPGPDELTRLDPPRTELGRRSLALLARLLSADDRPAADELRTLLDCPVIAGATLAPPAR
ncbi:LacI family DNA-binding transcriptional regulator [Cellulomonas sp. RIT-PI-Y]|uniref:LacI family DNA-binding transcriptional regulator n=1 Tax=Cellulomonas sp. RIT-PI-Y TaxID=3035297 RepID=UPI0021D9A631|nr:LacI family DNA-binding transcriptional regulator [Cellulomonas sp. RIT-PI-Y]